MEFLRRGRIVHSEQWQGIDISKKPEMAMHEVLHYSFSVDTQGARDVRAYQNAIKPNLPWADDHFLERVSGWPMNPGREWANWPYSKSADTFRDNNGQFNHNYMERYWPRWAGCPWFLEPTAHEEPSVRAYVDQGAVMCDDRGFPRPPLGYDENIGIRGRLGDLGDVISLLEKTPLTRQAFLPVWFPEDTGDANPGRKPCTLGYHFIMRDNKLDLTYYIRSCDFVRHFRDDIYLSIRLLLWVLNRLGERDDNWKRVEPGEFVMHITSLHFFRNDWQLLFPNVKPPTT